MSLDLAGGSCPSCGEHVHSVVSVSFTLLHLDPAATERVRDATGAVRPIITEKKFQGVAQDLGVIQAPVGQFRQRPPSPAGRGSTARESGSLVSFLQVPLVLSSAHNEEPQMQFLLTVSQATSRLRFRHPNSSRAARPTKAIVDAFARVRAIPICSHRMKARATKTSMPKKVRSTIRQPLILVLRSPKPIAPEHMPLWQIGFPEEGKS